MGSKGFIDFLNTLDIMMGFLTCVMLALRFRNGLVVALIRIRMSLWAASLCGLNAGLSLLTRSGQASLLEPFISRSFCGSII